MMPHLVNKNGTIVLQLVVCLTIKLSSVPKLHFSVQQSAHLYNQHPRNYEEAVKGIYFYLLKASNDGFILKPDQTRDLECYVDADWVSN